MDWEHIFTIATPFLVGFLSVFASYVIGVKMANRTLKIESLKDRYNKFYLPFIDFLIRGTPKLPYIITDLKIASLTADLLMKNIQYQHPKAIKLSLEFFNCFLDYLEYRNGNPNYDKQVEIKLNIILLLLSLEILSEVPTLSRQLKLPDISKAIHDQIRNAHITISSQEA